ncbi:zf-HC2 domain-containing protein [Jatrophihabitans sp.]|uniref:zf-HC2 domain-containing protein n=1 Tax=Jatrophihabitans sp. TaxID=1932789 RepID=UPI0030C7789C|nr:hypothetical protein [Jatrophihabitans sp.]
MTTQTWHVPPEVWPAYVSGRLGPAAEASLETHVMGCPSCRSEARAHVSSSTTEAIWSTVQVTVTSPQVSRLVQWLGRLGVPEHELVLLGSADAVLVPWVTAVGAALAVALISGLGSAVYLSHDVLFVALAPLVPVLAVLAAFEATETLREVSAATPYSKLRLCLIRATTALSVAVPTMMALGLLVPVLEPLAFLWLLPALVLTTSALVLLTWMPARVVGAVLGLAWMSIAFTAGGVGRLDLVTAAIPQVVFAGVGAALVGLLVLGTSGGRLLGGEG